MFGLGIRGRGYDAVELGMLRAAEEKLALVEHELELLDVAGALRCW